MFYEELKLDLEKLIKTMKFEEALLIINEELSMPYIPRDFEKYLLTTKKTILNLINDKQQSKKNNQLSLQEIQNDLLSEDLVKQILAIQALKDINVRPLLTSLQNYLLNPSFKNDNKTLILLILQEQQISSKIKINKNGKILEVVPMNLKSENLFLFFKEGSEIIEQVIAGKNPTITNNATNSLLIFLMDLFPEFDNLIINDLIAAVIKKTYDELGLNLSWNDLKTKLDFNLDNAQSFLIKSDLD